MVSALEGEQAKHSIMAQVARLGACVWSSSVRAARCKKTLDADPRPLHLPPHPDQAFGGLPCLGEGSTLSVSKSQMPQARQQAITTAKNPSQFFGVPMLEEGVQLSLSARVSSPNTRVSEGTGCMDEPSYSLTPNTNQVATRGLAVTKRHQVCKRRTTSFIYNLKTHPAYSADSHASSCPDLLQGG